MPSCEFDRRIGAYHDGELPVGQRRDIEEHMRHCPACARELRRLVALSRFFSAAGTPQMPSDALARLHRTIDSVPERIVIRTAAVFAAAAAALLLARSVWLWQTSSGPPSYPTSVPAWERVAQTPQADVLADAGAESRLAEWIVEDLSLENGHE